MVETMGVLKQIVVAGARVFYYLEDKERTLDSPIEKAMMALETFGAELEREKTRQRVVDAMTRNAKQGHWCGGDCYGYDRVEAFGEPDAAGRRVRQYVRLRINEKEAAVIRQIFALSARGLGGRRIAELLNVEGAPAPRPKCARPRSWSPSSIREILNRPIYRGELVWNRRRKRDKWGKKDTQPRPEAQWIHVPMPDLAIVHAELWTSA
jgi:site-specific DNA recombinase